MAELQDVARAGDVDVENSKRIVEIVFDTDDRGQVKNRVDAGIEGFLQCGDIGSRGVGRSRYCCRGCFLRSRKP